MNNSLRILLVEDNPGDADLIMELLSKDGPVSSTVKCAPRLAEALALLKQNHFDVVLLDLGLPDSAGLDTVRTMEQQAVDTPVVVLTGNNDEQLGLAAIQAGAQDYVVKGQLNGSLLLQVLRYALERHQNARRLRESEFHYRLLAEHMSDTVWLMDLHLKTIYASPSVQKLRGFSIEEIKNLPLEKHLTPASLQVAMSLFREELARVQADMGYSFVRTIEQEFYRKDGSTFWSENTFSLIRDPNGLPVSILGEGRDITERKLAQEQIMRQLDELQRWQDVMLSREERVQELKHEVNELCRRAGEPGRYPSQGGGLEDSEGETI